MPLIEWNQELAVNVKQCDEQHEQLIGLINDLHNAVKTGNGKNFNGLFRATVASVKRHFSEEEKLLRKHGYLGYQDQKEAHELFLSEAKNLLHQFKSGGLLAVSLENLLKRIESHILGEDKKYGRFLNSKGVY